MIVSMCSELLCFRYVGVSGRGANSAVSVLRQIEMRSPARRVVSAHCRLEINPLPCPDLDVITFCFQGRYQKGPALIRG